MFLALPYPGPLSLQTRSNLKKSLKGILNCCKLQNKLSTAFRFKDCIPKSGLALSGLISFSVNSVMNPGFSLVRKNLELEKWVFIQKVKEKRKKWEVMEKSEKIQYSDTIFFSLAKFESLSLTFLKIMFLIKLISVYFLLCVVLYFWTAKVFSNGSNQVKIPGKL